MLRSLADYLRQSLKLGGSFNGLTSLLDLFRGFSVSLLRLHTARLVSSVRFQLSAGRCRAVFAFPVRRENSVRYFEQYVKKIVLYIE